MNNIIEKLKTFFSGINFRDLSKSAVLVSLAFLFMSLLRYRLDGEIHAGVIVLFGLFIVFFAAGITTGARDIKNYLVSRSGKKGMESSFNVLLVLLILIALYLVFYFRLIDKKIDFTKNKLFSLTDKSVKVMERLKEPVEILVFDVKYDSDPVYSLLCEYSRKSKNVTFRYVDAVKDPMLAKKYNVSERGSLVFIAEGKKHIKLTRQDMSKLALDDYGRQITEYRYEQKITASLLSFLETEKAVCYFLEGHGEKTITDYEEGGLSKIAEFLQIENIIPKTLNLIKEKEIPADANIIVICGPRGEIFAHEREKIIDFVKKSGKLFLLSDPLPDTKEKRTGLEQISRAFGIILHDDIVIDPQAYMPMIQFGKKVMQGSPIYPVLQYDYHQIVNDISRQNLICVFISARSISRADDMPQNYIYNTLFNTTEAGWGETDFTDSRPRFDKKKDIPGPVYSGAVVQFKTGAKTGNVKPAEGRVAVFGDSDFICNGIADGPGHKDLFANTIQWLLDQERDITIRPKKAEEAELFLSAAEQLMMQLVFIILLPLAIAGSGIAVFMHRRKIN